MTGLVDLENEEEVKEQLNSSEIQYMNSCNKERDEVICYQLAEFMEIARKNFYDAAEVYKKCCESFHFAPCCYKSGQFHALGRGGMTKSKEEAYECYKMACEQSNYVDRGIHDQRAASCNLQGLLLGGEPSIQLRFLKSIEKRESEHRNDLIFSEMMKIFERSCELKNSFGCGFLSQIYLLDFKEAPKNFKSAAKYAHLACEYGEASSCHNLAIMYERGEGVVRDMVRSAEFAKRRNQLINDKVNTSK